MIRLSRSIVGQAEAEAVSRTILDDGYLGMGKDVELFEQDIAQYLGVPIDWVVCVNSGTAALHLAVEACLVPGEEILVQSLTYVASFQAISAAGVIPLSCEVAPETITIDLEDASRRITSKTKAIMPVHYASNPGNLRSIYDFAYANGLRVIEDAAHAFGCTYLGNKIGSVKHLNHSASPLKLIVCFSFDGIKNITSGEGGAVVTADEAVAQYVRDSRLLGVQKDTERRYRGERSWEFDVTNQGYRYHMSNIMAAIGCVQLERLESEFAPKRRALASIYREVLCNQPGIALLATGLKNIIPHIQPIRVLDGKRDGLRAYLARHGIQTGIHYKPNHLLRFYGGGKPRLPVTERLYGELLSLPLHPGLSEEDVGYVIEKVREYFRGS